MIVWNEFVNDARVLKEAQTLAAAQYRVKVFALHTPGKTLQSEVLQENLEVSRVARSPLWRWRRRKGTTTPVVPSSKTNSDHAHITVLRVIARAWTHLCLLLKMAAYRPDIIHAHDVNTLPTAWLVRIITGAQLIYDAHEISTSREGYAGLKKIVARVEGFLLPRASAVITTTDTRAKYLARLYNVKRPFVLQNRPRHFICSKTRILYEKLGLTEQRPILLYQGGLQSGRGLEKLIRCTKHLQPCYVVLIGGGRLTAKLMHIRDELGLQNTVHFIPTVALSELPQYTAGADIAVQPIENTCFNHFSTDSNKLFEYIIAGVPTVATNFPEIRKVISKYQTGLLVPAGNDEALIESLNKLICDTLLRQSLAENSKKAANNLSWETQERRFLQLYHSIQTNTKDKVA